MELPSLFGLLVTAGFPHLLRVGSVVQVANSDDGKCVVTDVSSGQSITAVNVTSRVTTVVSSVISCVTISVIGYVTVNVMSLVLLLLISLVVCHQLCHC